MDTYQAVYDAVRSKISTFDAHGLQERITANFDFSHHMETIRQEFMIAANEMMRPSVMFKPQLSMDGNSWCALYGENLQTGVAGFGDSPDKAMRVFDEEWIKLNEVKP